jgi:hypothetical protein
MTGVSVAIGHLLLFVVWSALYLIGLDEQQAEN